MDEKDILNENAAVKIPLKSFDEGETKIDDGPPPYEDPQIDFSSGWKDKVFGIIFWIHTIAVIIVGLVLGIPVIRSFVKDSEFNKIKIPSDFDFKPYLYGLGVAIATGGLVSFLTFLLLQSCTSRIIKCSFVVIILYQILLAVLLLFIFWPLCFIPGTFLFIIFIYLSCVRKRIPFAEAHLQAGCDALRAHPSLLLITIVMLIVEFLWFIFWFLMVLGIQNASNNIILFPNFNLMKSANNSTSLNVTRTESQWMIKTTTTMSLRENSMRLDDDSIYSNDKPMNTKQNSDASTEKWYSKYVNNVIRFLLLFSWYWGATTFGNIAHFITACAVGHWWFTGKIKQQYTIGTSIKRSFTTNFGTICFGSFFEAVIKALRAMADDKRRKSIVALILSCILRLIEKAIGYLNEWAFIYSALTGQSYIQAGKCFIELFRKRGWTAIINDALIGTTLAVINLGIGLVTCVVGVVVMHIFLSKPSEQIHAIIIVAIMSLLIGLFMSTIVTTVLTSCVRTVFVCFALNSPALGASHPDHLERLTTVWHQFYPQEFANSGFNNQFIQQTV